MVKKNPLGQLPYLSVYAPFVYTEEPLDSKFPGELQTPMSYDPKIMDEIYTVIETWCFRNQFLMISASHKEPIPVILDATTPAKKIYEFNIRSFIYADNLYEFLDYIERDAADALITKLHNLLTQICMLVGARSANALLNITYRSFDAMTRGIAEASEKETLTWDRIHQECPYLWVIYLIHYVMHRYTPMNT